MVSSRIFVKNLPPSLTEEEFKAHFSQKHAVTDAKFIGHRRIGYVGYKTPEDAASAVTYFNKSFIRMSKIGVELARPVTDNSIPANARQLLKGQTDGTYAPHEDQVSQPENSLKRKRNLLEDENPNPKLKEFLGVMQRPSQSKSFLNEAVDNGDNATLAAHDDVAAAQGSDDSEEERQVITKKIKVSQRDAGESERVPGLLIGTATTSPKSIEQGDGGSVEAREQNAGPKDGQSDADWLRSKTSRLLGLVEEGTEIAEKLPEPKGSEVELESIKTQPPAPKSIDVSLVDVKKPLVDADEQTIRNTRRLYLRNLPYAIVEDDVTEHFASFDGLEEVHVAMDSKTGGSKGFAFVQFSNPDIAVQVWKTMDKSIFQGRLLHILPAASKRENKLDDFAISKLTFKQQRQIQQKARASNSTFNWNALYMNTDTVMSAISARLGVEKSTLLDPTSSDAAVKQALAETHIIQETRAYFAGNGVDLESFKSKKRGDTTILVKDFPFGTNPDELRKMFEEHGKIHRFLMPSSGVIAIVEFVVSPEARAAFKSLAYRKIKDTVLKLEWAPKDVFSGAAKPVDAPIGAPDGVAPKISATDLLHTEFEAKAIDTSTLFVRNLNFTTTAQLLTDTFSPLDGFISARVKTKTDPKKPGQILSMGFGFLEFRTKEQAQAALAAMNGYSLEAHKLDIRASQKSLDAAEDRRKESRQKTSIARGTKIIIKNLPFEASKKEVRALFAAYGQLRSIRVPKKFDSSTRGFAFADFSTPREAGNAMDALRNTHLLGRRLVLEFAEAEAKDAEEELERMQKKVGAQTNKVSIQKLTGAGRRKFNVSGEDPKGP
ncbi:putative pre-rRNA processing protein Mrd1 [Tothia fuscella]|uniref:Multiple RNA-binding domain-containing protein 1 n=1 Tax=Tothia fuscella TaxID=1048955 RepID=A0A9P4P1L8_9PEZI|nr:putative pre-rRNA processing protein Mrd1 [Tothia fuscella]